MPIWTQSYCICKIIEESEKERTEDEDTDRKSTFVVQKSLKAQLRHKKDYRKELKDLHHKYDGSSAKDRRAWNAVFPFQSQLLSVQSVVEGYRQCSHELTEHFTADINDSFCALLYDVFKM